MGITYSNIDELPPKVREQVKIKDAVQKAKRSKYGNVKTEINGIKFDSKKEARRYIELLELSKAGQITGLKLQRTFTLQEAFKTPEGEKVAAIKYVADFVYEQDGILVVEDVKSEITKNNAAYKLKKKMMAERGFIIQEV
mgnify:CR=1 FL=1